MQSPTPTNLMLLLQVFRQGLVLDLVSKSDVTSWADDIILSTNEPEYFLIEVSLCSNKNDLLEIISASATAAGDIICARVLLGLLYKKLIGSNDTLSTESAAKLIGQLQHFDALTSFEAYQMYAFDDYDLYYGPNLTELQTDIVDFLSTYAAFTLTNYEDWAEINSGVEAALTQKKAEFEIEVKANRKEWELKDKSFIKKQGKQSFKQYLSIGILIAVIAAIILCAYLTPAAQFDWSAVIGPIVICVLLIGKEYFLKLRRR